METLFLKLLKSLLNFTLVHLYIYLSIYRKTGIKIANRILKQYTRTSNYENVCVFVVEDYLGDNTWN